jgi:hypothetical protein
MDQGDLGGSKGCIGSEEASRIPEARPFRWCTRVGEVPVARQHFIIGLWSHNVEK